MKKKLLLPNGTEIKLGEKVNISHKEPNKSYTIIGVLTEALVKTLIELGEIEEVEYPEEEKEENQIPPAITKLGYYIHQLAMRGNCSDREVWKTLDEAHKDCPGMAIQALLWDIARIMDERYEDHIKTATKAFMLRDSFLGVKPIANASFVYKLYPLFRSIGDAEVASSLVRPYVLKTIE